MKHYWISGLVGALAVSATASAQEARIEQVGPPAAPPPTAEALAAPLRPDWIKMPTADQMAREYPPGTPKGMEATVKLRCVVTARGMAETCKVLDETPFGRGFGRAALKAIRYFQMRPTSLDNVPVAGREVYLNVMWRNAASYRPISTGTP